MKKYKYYLITIIIVMIIPILYKISMKQAESTYKMNQYEVKERFYIKGNKHNYEFTIKNKNEEYSYVIENKIHKRTKIIKEIKTYKEGDVKCILPIYKNKKELELYCRKNNIQVSREALKEDSDFIEILKKVNNAKLQTIEEDTTKTTYRNITVYQNNIPENETIIIWDYKGIVILTRHENQYQQFIDYDMYDNILSAMTSRYFVLFENTSVSGIEKIHVYDRKKNRKEEITLKEKFSKNSYINGVINDLIYVTDKEKKKQYTVNILKNEVVEVGNAENQFIKYTNGEKEKVKISDFLMEEQYFQNVFITDEKISSSNELLKEDNYYYYQKDDTFYRKREDANKVELFTLEGVEEWYVIKGELVLRKEDTLYLYADQTGLRRVLKYNELKYNHNNIYNIWK